jgi:hypothetical protein
MVVWGLAGGLAGKFEPVPSCILPGPGRGSKKTGQGAEVTVGAAAQKLEIVAYAELS